MEKLDKIEYIVNMGNVEIDAKEKNDDIHLNIVNDLGDLTLVLTREEATLIIEALEKAIY